MKRPTKWFVAIGLAGAMTVGAAAVSAQDIQRFDDDVDAEGQQDVALPGAPAPEQEQPEQQVQQPQQTEEDEEGEGMHGTYQIRFGGADGPAGPADQPGRADVPMSDDLTELYQGVIPGERDEVGHVIADIDEGDPNPLTWVGFRPEDDKTRVFFQAPEAVQYQIREDFDENEIVVVFEHAEIRERNFSRFIDASHFDRAVERIEARETDDGNVEVTLTMNEQIEPSTEIEGQYLYLDFPHDDGADGAQADAEAQ